MTRLALALAAGLAIGLLLGYAAGSATATSGSALNGAGTPGTAPHPSGASASQSGPTGAPHLTGASPSLPPPAVASVRPTATVAAPEPETSPAPGTALPTAPGSALAASVTWYCNADPSRGPLSRCRIHFPDRPGVADLFAATSPALWAQGWTWGTELRVCYHGCVLVRIVDRCASCHGIAVDLYADAFERIAALSRGRVAGEVRW